MCGIAGLIHRDGATSVGKEMTAMLKSLKHRGPDSTGFAIYGPSTANEYVMRLKLAEQEDMTKDHHIRQKIRERQAEVDRMLAEIGAETRRPVVRFWKPQSENTGAQKPVSHSRR